jgi:glycosyltransferase involved in cell wall biosynthesis
VPSLYEGFCNAAVEAMGCGVPVVASNIDVLREVVGEGGQYVDPHDAAAVAAGIEALLTDTAKRETLGARARERARARFPIERTVEEYATVYRRVHSS